MVHQTRLSQNTLAAQLNKKEIVMYSTYYVLEKSVIDNIENKKYGDAIDLIRDFVTAVRHGDQAPGLLIGSSRLDALCELIGENFFKYSNALLQAHEQEDAQSEGVVVLCTGLYRYGGTSLVIEDIINAHKNVRCTVLVTNLLNDMSSDDLSARNFADIGGVVETAPSGNSQEKMKWLMRKLFSIAPKRIFLLNHPQDSIIISAVQPFIQSTKVIFYHHADHNLCLGVHLKNAIHIDPHNVGFFNCRTNEKIADNYYLPLLVDDRAYSAKPDDFLQNEELTTCSSATYHKFNNFYLYPYVDLIIERLLARGGKHVHIGNIPAYYLAKVENKLREQQVNPARFIHIPWAPSLWDALIKNRVDLFIGSFPIGGARTLIEVMGAGLPILMHESYLSRFYSSRDIAYPDAFVWKYPHEWTSIISSVDKKSLQVHSELSRKHYLQHYSSVTINFDSAVEKICAGEEPVRPYALYSYNPDNLDRLLHFSHLSYLTATNVGRQFLTSNTWKLGYLFRAATKLLIRSRHLTNRLVWSIKGTFANSSKINSQLPVNRIALFVGLANHDSGKKLDHYFSAMADNFAAIGFGVDIYAGHEYTRNASMYGLNENIDFSKLNTEINSKNYRMVLSVNNALLTKRLQCLSGISVVDLIVDDFNHLFKLDQCSIYEQFNVAKHIIFSSHSHINQLKINNTTIEDRVKFIPTATSVFKRLPEHLKSPKKYNIAWIASLLDASGFSRVLHLNIGLKDKINLLQNAVQCTKDGHPIQYDEQIGECSLDRLIAEYAWTRPYFEIQAQNTVSNDSRISIVNRLHKFGLHLFGNREWMSAAAYHPKIVDAYHDGRKISSHSDIMKIYNSSKICINVPQVQTNSALPYRVIDILASDALLITKYHPESDAFAMFGKDCPIVMYQDIDDLVRLCEYYLIHEEERLALVVRCNDLVKNGFDFNDRCKDILNLAGVFHENMISNTGYLNYINSGKFLRKSVKIKVQFKLSAVRLAKNLLKLIPFSLRRSLLINLQD